MRAYFNLLFLKIIVDKHFLHIIMGNVQRKISMSEKLYNNDILRKAIESDPALNPTKVAAAADVSLTTVHNAMNGEDVRISTLRRIANAVKVDIKELVEVKAA